MLERGMIRETSPDEALERVAKEIVEARATGKEVVAVSSVHRISEALAERVHDLHIEKLGREGQTFLDIHVKRDLQPAELRSSQFYRIGDIIEYKQDDAIVRASVASVLPDALTITNREKPLPLGHVRAVFDLSRMERGPGEKLLLQEKIKQGDRIFEKGSRQTIARVVGDTVQFESGLRLRATDGRVRQADCLTDYKAQGIKGAQVRGIEDNGSAMVMANKEAFHVKGTRHVQNLIMHVENKGLYVEAIQRSNVKFSALQLERIPIAPTVVPPLAVDKGRLLMKLRSWGRDFLPRVSMQKRAEKIRQRLSRLEALRPRVEQVVAEKVTSAAKETIGEKTPEKIAPVIPKPITENLPSAPSQTPRQKPKEGLTSPVEEMAQKLEPKRDEAIAEKPKPVSPPSEQPKQTPYYAPTVHRPRQGRGMRM
jgi:hypothetical protein